MLVYKSNGKEIKPTCEDCKFIKLAIDGNRAIPHCSNLPMTTNNKIELVQKNSFREFVWRIDLIPKESIVVPLNFACINFKPLLP